MRTNRKIWILGLCLAAASAGASNIDDYCPAAVSRFEQVLAHSGMEATIETAMLVLSNPGSTKEEKYWALPLIGCSENERYASNLIAALADPDWDVRGGAIIAMRYMRSESTFSSLIDIVTDEAEDEKIRQIGTGVLSQIGGENVDVAWAIAGAAQDTSQNSGVRFNHVFSLGRLTSPQSVIELNAFLDDRDANVGAAAAVALAKHGVRKSIPYLVQAIMSPTTAYWMKMKAVRELERLANRDFEFADLGRPLVKEQYDAAQAEVCEWYEANKQEFVQ